MSADRSVIVLRNYNRFVQHTERGPQCVDLYIHRFRSDWQKLAKFTSGRAARRFLRDNPQLEAELEASFWPEVTSESEWVSNSTPWGASALLRPILW